MKRFWYVLVMVVLILAVGSPAAAQSTAAPAPLLAANAAEAISGRYIVVLKDGATSSTLASSLGKADRMEGVQVHFQYEAALKGFAASLPPAALEAVRKDPNVAYVEADAIMSIDITQTGATWGLDRIDQRNLPLSTTYSYTNTGAGVTAYIIDTGMRISHTEFSGRASIGYDAVGDGRNGIDCHGHGTHVAGTVGGSTYGVAKGVTLVAVRVLNCSGSGTTSGVIAGINWVTSNHQAGQPAVANMSLGGGPSTSLDTAVKNSIADGVTYAIAAGNNNRRACNYSPARIPAAITVGATTSTDTRASYSNYGSCLDLFAPGSSITSAWNTSDTATNTISGTSMATPHVAGVAALYLQSNPSASPAAVSSALVANSTSGVVKSPGSGSPNRLLFTNY